MILATGLERHAGAEARRGAPREWCAAYGLNTSSSWKESLYNTDVATRFATEWCARYQHFFSIWQRAGGSYSYRYSADDYCLYVADSSWTEFRGQVAADSPGFRRNEQIGCGLLVNP